MVEFNLLQTQAVVYGVDVAVYILLCHHGSHIENKTRRTYCQKLKSFHTIKLLTYFFTHTTSFEESGEILLALWCVMTADFTALH